MKRIVLISVLLCANFWWACGQTVFSETFNEANNSINGVDAIGPTAWTTVCTYCDGMCANPPQGNSTNDFIKVMNGELMCQDTNGPATWETDDFDISPCTEGITISCDIRSPSDLETATTGCLAADGIKFEVSYDGGTSWIAYSDAINGHTGTGVLMSDCGATCTSPCSGNYPVGWCGLDFNGPLIGATQTTGVNPDIIPDHTFSDCASVGISSTMRFRAQFVTWAGSEQLYMDDVMAVCSNCALPVEIGQFEVLRMVNSTLIDWKTITEVNNKKFKIERSTDGMFFYEIGDARGSVNSNSVVEYQFIDKNPPSVPTTYYRLAQVDLNGKTKYSEIKTVHHEPTEVYFTGQAIAVNFASAPNQSYHLNIYNLSGQLVHSDLISTSTEVAWNQSGFYIVEIVELGIRQKVVTK